MGETRVKTSIQIRADLWWRFKAKYATKGTTITDALEAVIEREVGPDA